jgi:FkbM family methyltransferase
MEVSKFDFDFKVTWSQGGEDLAFLHMIPDYHDGFYIDIGAHHPDRFSVTRHLYQSGWHGINVDANPDLEMDFVRRRPRDIFVNAAVGKLAEYEIYIFKEPAISTVDTFWKENQESIGRAIKDVKKIRGITLRELLSLKPENRKVDLINIDIEGADFDALSSIEFETLKHEYKPTWLMLETKPPIYNALDYPAVKYALDNGYEPWLILPMATLLKLRD